MNTRILMIASALFMAVLGMSLSFLPEEIGNWLGLPGQPLITLGLQMLAGVYLGFAILNWMAKAVVIGGIYAKPLALGNMLHFSMSALAIFKMIDRLGEHFQILLTLAFLFAAFALAFAYLSFFVAAPRAKSA